MSTRAMLVGILIAVASIGMILFVIFGQVTVRKLRKNPETRDRLGVSLVSGWDIVNVAGALALPRVITERKAKSKGVKYHID